MRFKHIKFLIFCCFLVLNIQLYSLAADYGQFDEFPLKVKEYINTHIANKDKFKFYYVMKWHGYKIYSIRRITYGIAWGGSEYYILYDGKNVRMPKPEERKQLRLDVRTKYNKSIEKTNRLLTRKLSRNAKKIMKIEDNTPPPQIPPALKIYSDKYMIKGDDVEFLYIMDWKGQHVYKTHWLRYGAVFNPLTVILYDGHTIRRPSKEEFSILYSPMCRAYEKYLIELGRSHNKD